MAFADDQPADGPTGVAPDLTAAATAEVPPEIAAQSLGEYFRAWFIRIRGGDTGLLPVVVALVIVAIYFQYQSSLFLSPRNLVYLFLQSSVFMVLAMAQGFVLLLGEIDLSVGFTMAVGGAVTAILVQPAYNYPWYVAIAAGLAACAFIGLVQGFVITRLRLPSLIVTLAGSLILNGVFLMLIGTAQEALLTGPLDGQQFIYNIASGRLPVEWGWVGLVVALVVLGLVLFMQDERRRRSGLVAPPRGLTALKIALFCLAGFAIVYICNTNRGVQLTIAGVPPVVPLVLIVLLAWTVLLEQTPYGRHVYAVGGNAEAARRAGINVANVRTIAFILCSTTAGLAGIIFGSVYSNITANIQGQAGPYVLYAVAAAVIGGTSLFGGRGRAIHGVLGGLAIGGIYNGILLLGYALQWQLIATGLVLLAAITIDAVSRRGSTTPTR